MNSTILRLLLQQITIIEEEPRNFTFMNYSYIIRPLTCVCIIPFIWTYPILKCYLMANILIILAVQQRLSAFLPLSTEKHPSFQWERYMHLL